MAVCEASLKVLVDHWLKMKIVQTNKQLTRCLNRQQCEERRKKEMTTMFQGFGMSHMIPSPGFLRPPGYPMARAAPVAVARPVGVARPVARPVGVARPVARPVGGARPVGVAARGRGRGRVPIPPGEENRTVVGIRRPEGPQAEPHERF